MKDILEVLRFVSKTDFSEVIIEQPEWKLTIRRGGQVLAPAPVAVPPSLPAPAPLAAEAPPPSKTAEPPKNTIFIRSPMVGTFYRAPSPDKPPYVEVGDIVQPGQVVCIIEAMKLFNEIQAETAGKIVRILVENAHPVEYDQPLFELEPLS